MSSEKETIVINILGGPGCGKTTVAADLFAMMKKRRYNVEYVQEYAKKLVILERWDDLDNQYSVSQKQYKLLRALKGKYDFIITDGPIIHGLYYNNFNRDNVSNIEKTDAAIIKWHNEFNNMNFFLERGDFFYERAGRYQDETTAKQVDKNIRQTLDSWRIFYTPLLSKDDTAEKIFERIENI